MSAAIEWFKAISTFIKDNKWLVLLSLSGMTSLATNVGQYFGIQEKETEVQAAQQQITRIAEHYAAPHTVKVCNCKAIFNQHIIKDH